MSAAEEQPPACVAEAPLPGFGHDELTEMLSYFEAPPAAALDGLEAKPCSSGSSDSAPAGRGASEPARSGASSPTAGTVSSGGASWVHYAPAMALPAGVGGGAQSLLVGAGPWWPAMPGVHQLAPSDGHSLPPAAPAYKADPKSNASHSTIEKQRRDRINSLIDELRDMVPPATLGSKGADGSDAKRPKHVVLSDTITLLRHLKERVQHDELELQHLRMLSQQFPAELAADPAAAAAAPAPVPAPAPTARRNSASGSAASAQSLLPRSLSSSSAPAAAAAAAAAAAVAAAAASPGCPELPQAPVNVPAAVGVVVEEGDGCFLVRINCKDRRGLLSDITGALGGLPLQITRAAITTSHSGAVCDVFEIVIEPAAADTEAVTALDVQFSVQQALCKWRARGGDASELKRQRSQ